MGKASIERGILLIAVGHANYYRMAATLAASIRANHPDLSICLATNNMVSGDHNRLFNSIVPVPDEMIYDNGKPAYIKSKLYMYELSPFKETIFLDVDQIMIMQRDLAGLFDQLADIDITFSNTGVGVVSVWADITEVKKLYGDEPFWNFHSELVYFKKGPTAKKYFITALKVWKDNKVKSAARFSGATMADELAFQIAAMITGIYPHKENWTPNFWYARAGRDSRKYPYELVNHITYSIGGNYISKAVKDNYNMLAKAYFAKLGLSHPYQVEDKRTFLPERKLI